MRGSGDRKGGEGRGSARSGRNGSGRGGQQGVALVHESSSTPVAPAATPVAILSAQQSGLNGGRGKSGRGDGSTRSPKAPPKSNGDESYGVVVTIRDNFGFIQPLIAGVVEQIYFSLREAYADIAIGDEVRYYPRQQTRGLQAAEVTKVPPESKVVVEGVKGTLVRESDVYHNTPGEIQVDITSLPPNDSSLTSDSSTAPLIAVFLGETKSPPQSQPQQPQQIKPRISKGDEVEFDLVRLIGTDKFIRASKVKVTRSKKSRLLEEQVQRMVDAGAVRERGVVDTFFETKEYGFIKPVDRAEQIYFRFSDLINPEGNETKVAEGTEVEFIVIAELVKGKSSDRAVHVQVLPKGSVQFETTIASDVIGVVSQEPRVTVHPQREEPGSIRLKSPVKLNNGMELQSVELWPRCMAEGLVLKVGDTLMFNLQNYRPEKLYFARGIRALSYRLVGREAGSVCAIKQEQGYGFIRPHRRDRDVYFRLNEVLKADGGGTLSESEIVPDMVLTFDVTEDTTSSGNLRAIRVREASKTDDVSLSALPVPPSTTENPPSSTSGGSMVLKKDLEGTVVREPKRDVPGIISAKKYDLIGDIDLEKIFDPEILAAMKELRDTPEIKDITLDYLTPSQVRSYHHTLNNEMFRGIAHESKLASPPQGGNANTNDKDRAQRRLLRIWKMDSLEEYDAWFANEDRARKEKKKEKENAAATVTIMKRGGSSTGSAAEQQEQVFFLRSDTFEDNGPVSKGLVCKFDLHYDLKTMQKVAKNVRSTDESIDGDVTHRGVLDRGFIRCVPSDEKLSWHYMCLAPNTQPGEMIEGSEVTFIKLKRGGARTAVNIKVVERGTNSGVPSLKSSAIEVVSGTCTAVIVNLGVPGVSPAHAILLDVSQCPDLAGKYIKPTILNELAQKQKQKTKDGDKQWEKVTLDNQTGTTSASQSLSSEKDDSVSQEQEKDAAEQSVLADSEGTGAATKQHDNIKYYPMLERVPIALALEGQGSPPEGASNLAVGDIVLCRVVADWIIQRHPVMLQYLGRPSPSSLPSSSSSSSMTKKQGSISRVKVRVKVSENSFCELVEIKERGTDPASSSSSSSDEGLYYCDFRELHLSADHTRENVQAGDEVEFLALPSSSSSGASAASNVGDGVNGFTSFAIDVHLQLRAAITGGIVFKRNFSINVALKQAKPGFKGISMAKGPPDDGTTGFAPGWRDPVPNIQDLPWAMLLLPPPPPLSTPSLDATVAAGNGVN